MELDEQPAGPVPAHTAIAQGAVGGAESAEDPCGVVEQSGPDHPIGEEVKGASSQNHRARSG